MVFLGNTVYSSISQDFLDDVPYTTSMLSKISGKGPIKLHISWLFWKGGSFMLPILQHPPKVLRQFVKFTKFI